MGPHVTTSRRRRGVQSACMHVSMLACVRACMRACTCPCITQCASAVACLLPCLRQVACTKAAADAWLAVEERRVAAAAAAQAAASADAAVAAAPGARRRREPQPWVDQGTAAELAAAAPPPPRIPVQLLFEKPLRDILGPCTSPSTTAAGSAGKGEAAGAAAAPARQRPHLVDMGAADLWSSEQSECPPVREPKAALQRARREAGAQAVPPLAERGVQVRVHLPAPTTACRAALACAACSHRCARRSESRQPPAGHCSKDSRNLRACSPRCRVRQATGGRLVPDSTQYEPRDLPAEDKRALMASPGLASFMASVQSRRACSCGPHGPATWGYLWRGWQGSLLRAGPMGGGC